MKKLAMLLVISAIIGRLYVCGQSVDLNDKTAELSSQYKSLHALTEALYLKLAQATSVTRLVDMDKQYAEIMLVTILPVDHSSVVAQTR